MRPETERSLIKRLLTHIEDGTTDLGESLREVDVDRYHSTRRLDAERAQIFLRRSVAVGHVAQLPEPGAYFTFDLAGRPLLVVRTREPRPRLRAFLNVCRHRGTRLVGAECGRAKSLVCPYHAWTYSLDGALIGVPDEKKFGDVARADHGLISVPVTEDAGLIWVHLGDDASAPGLGALGEELEGWVAATSHVAARRTLRRNANWKLLIDGALESYHIKKAHEGTIYPLFINNLALVDRFGPHLRLIYPKRSLRDLAELPRDQWALRPHANTIYFLFPSTLVLALGDHANVLHVVPEAEDRSRIECAMLVPEPPSDTRTERYWALNDRLFHDTLVEDFDLAESIQASFSSGANTHLTWGRCEQALGYFHDALDAALTMD